MAVAPTLRVVTTFDIMASGFSGLAINHHLTNKYFID